MRPDLIIRYFLILLSLSPALQAQRVFYSDTEKDDYRQMNFEIIGRVGGNISVYKNYRTNNFISVYDNSMKLLNKVKLEFLPDKLINVDFVAYPDAFYMFYQYQKKNIIHCDYVKMNGEGKLIQEPAQLDTTQVPGFSDNRVYSVINSDDKQQIMLFKINKRNEKRYIVTMKRFNADLKLQRTDILPLEVNDHEGVFTEFVMDNDGDFVFGRCARNGSQEYISRLDVVAKRAASDSFNILNIPLNGKTLDEVKIKPDNINRKFVLTSFFYKQKKGNIEGIYNWVWDKNIGKISATNNFIFGDTLRLDARSENTPPKQAFNDYFIKQIIPKRDGGFAVLAELYYSTSRSAGWNRWDYLYGYNYYSPMDYGYYSPYSSLNYYRYWDPYNRYNSMNATRHYAENIVILSFDNTANLQWSNVIRKTQYDDNTDIFISYQIFYSVNEVRFLFNQLERREQLLNSVSVNAAGQMKRDPTLKSLDPNYEFMPRYGKQVGARQVVLPCMYKNYICFAKIEF
jgi:hypothetical protein